MNSVRLSPWSYFNVCYCITGSSRILSSKASSGEFSIPFRRKYLFSNMFVIIVIEIEEEEATERSDGKKHTRNDNF